ncbi:hypothetical protein [Halanaeroarchaeum sulfurireducens]|uniref:hypothetical protein n=1 Tax=Halanaeroarchaeum sulfurireducens TaxID=1604004 RepID=UPI000679CE44|nr:hypothetical protein [Halanaeroarchaeum sulfurireducens]
MKTVYLIGRIDHEAVVDTLRDLEGKAICSYEELPANVAGLHVVERDGGKRFMGNGKAGERRRRLNGW